ncbi:sugar phosphate isomerase/epimerase [Microbacterium panaciterrae]|uniref:Sugar phosphate isomerase/epimerase n=1 Tax=Microbacterium panaciterrae TaxID=985759 RepID=A0ABP8P2W5_9MICO
MASPQLSVQLYTVRDALATDLPGTLAGLAAAGFAHVEAFGFLGNAAALRAAYDGAGLTAPSGHANFLSDELRFGETVITIPPFASILDDAETLGIEILIDPMVAPDRWASRDEIEKTADRLNGLVDVAAARGIRLGYHNHSQEFHHDIDGVPALEHFAGLLDERVVLELDVFWAAIGGADVPALLQRLGDRVRLLHMKDGVIGADPFRSAEGVSVRLDQRVAGEGDLDIAGILAAAPAAEYAIVEFDQYDGDILDAVTRSAAALRAEGVR